MIRKEGSSWILYSHDGSKKLGAFKTRAEAEKRKKQVEYFKNQLTPPKPRK